MKTFLALATIMFAVSATPALCAEKAKPTEKKAMMEMTPAQREEMAAMHEKMAACLRSDKPIKDCHKEMMDTCKNAKNGCPMMKHMHGMKHEMMEDESAEKGESK
ncbi:MAG: hypothetical protein ACXVB9_08870 [Bdellovibrionota bacterium]